MHKNEFLLYDKKQPIRLHVTSMTVYAQSKIIETYTENNEVYYLFFFKDNFLTARKATRLKLNSHIANAFKKGIIFHHPHPLINTLYSSCSPLKSLSFDQLMKKLETQYTQQEKALILTYFESFTPQKELFKHIQNIFYQFQRNGQLFEGYKIIQILLHFTPDHSWVKPLAGSLAFKKYADLYKELSEDLFKKDLIFVEQSLFLQKENQQSFQRLVSILSNESRWSDLISLFIYKFSLTPSNDTYHNLLQLLGEHLHDEEITDILADLSLSVPNSPELHLDLIEKFFKLNKVEEAISLISEQSLDLNASQVRTLEGILENLNLEDSNVQIEKINYILLPLFKSEPEKLEKILRKCVTQLFKNKDINFIKEWLTPVRDSQLSLPIIEIINKMQILSEDPNQQQLLGEFYYQFNQFDKAIECFSWEMELHNNDPKPVQWLSKIYQVIGMKDEYKAYQQLYIEMQK
ncbi:hypothetical protein RJD24_20080 [Bacillaceae bacterium IKA-2]|nr:hypothetical protein RJD24_20080 [Bacillaceae bacterium IKA-2]